MYTYMSECMFIFISMYVYISVCQDTARLENKERSCWEGSRSQI